MVFAGCGDDDPASPGGGGGGGKTTPLSFDTFQAAELAIGQADLSSGAPNGGGAISASGISGPYGAPAQGSLYAPDQSNHRVLGFSSMPASSGASADFVLGQDDFVTGSSGTAADEFRSPLRCVTAGGKLLLLEIGNNRILIWNSLPTSNVPADVVVGQPDFTLSASGTSATNLNQPIDMFVYGGRLFVSDYINNRVLIWNSIPSSNGAAADVVVGQPDFTTATPGLSATALAAPRGIWVGDGKLVVCDGGNRRVLIWNTIPQSNGAPADLVVGAPDLNTAGSGTDAAATNIGRPLSATSDGNTLYVADGTYHRVLIYPFPDSNGAAATKVLGQTNFTLSAGNDPNQDGVSEGVVSARTFATGSYSPNGITIIGRQLIVTDQSNNRYMVFTSTQ
jgi:hypothetical protein